MGSTTRGQGTQT